MDIKVDLLQWFINILINRPQVEELKMRIFQTKNQLKFTTTNYSGKKFKKRKAQSPFIGSIWGVDLTGKQLISKLNKGFRFLLGVIDIYTKNVWLIHLKDKKEITITNAFQNVSNKSIHTPNKYGQMKGVNLTIDQ